MPRRKRKKSRGKSQIGQFLGGAFRFSLRLIPFVLVFAGVFGIFTGVREALYADTYLTLQRVSVVPSGALTSRQREQIESKWLGDHILQVDIGAMADYLEKDPTIKTAQVLRQPPNEVAIHVDKRKAFGYVRFHKKGHWALISEDGVVLDTLSQKTPAGLHIEAIGLGSRKPALGYSLGRPHYKDAVAFYQAFMKHPLARHETLTKIKLDRLGNVAVILGQGPELRLGKHPMDSLVHLSKIGSLLENGNREKIDYIDLQFDDIIIKKRR